MGLCQIRASIIYLGLGVKLSSQKTVGVRLRHSL